MKRNMELIRAILLKLEEDQSFPKSVKIEVDGFSGREIQYHLFLLHDAGFIEGHRIDTESPEFCVRAITNAGHDFLAYVKNDTLWNKAKEMAGTVSQTVPLAVISQTLTKLALKAIGVT